ncbi:transposase [Rhizobium leguminosarum]|nr:transposase [Rhizobium leguminosarum]
MTELARSASRRVEVVIGEEHRRRWNPEDKATITAASFVPGANISAVARQYGVSRGLLHYWRRCARGCRSPTHDQCVNMKSLARKTLGAIRVKLKRSGKSERQSSRCGTTRTVFEPIRCMHNPMVMPQTSTSRRLFVMDCNALGPLQWTTPCCPSHFSRHGEPGGELGALVSSSDWFVLIASPDLAKSLWVGHEIDYWCDHKSVDRFIIVNTAGEINWDDASSDLN